MKHAVLTILILSYMMRGRIATRWTKLWLYLSLYVQLAWMCMVSVVAVSMHTWEYLQWHQDSRECVPPTDKREGITSKWCTRGTWLCVPPPGRSVTSWENIITKVWTRFACRFASCYKNFSIHAHFCNKFCWMNLFCFFYTFTPLSLWQQSNPVVKYTVCSGCWPWYKCILPRVDPLFQLGARLCL